MVNVTVSIVNWNTKDEIRQCLASIFANCANESLEIIVVDNASTDDSVAMLESEYAGRIRLIKNTTNEGFGSGHNRSLGIAAGRYVLILNPDARITQPQTIEKMAAYMDESQDIGLLGPRILNPDGSLQYSARHYPTMFAGVFRHTVLGKLFPNNRFVREYLMTNWEHDQICDVDWISGSAMMIRRKTLEEIGPLDERFFMYCEDVDWCKRAHMAGWRVVYYPLVTICHRIGASSDQNAAAMIRRHHQSMLRYFLKYNARSPRVLLTPFVMLALWLRTRSLLKRTKS